MWKDAAVAYYVCNCSGRAQYLKCGHSADFDSYLRHVCGAERRFACNDNGRKWEERRAKWLILVSAITSTVRSVQVLTGLAIDTEGTFRPERY